MNTRHFDHILQLNNANIAQTISSRHHGPDMSKIVTYGFFVVILTAWHFKVNMEKDLCELRPQKNSSSRVLLLKSNEYQTCDHFKELPESFNDFFTPP